MKEIKLTQDKVALVDDKDFAWVNSFNWFAKKSRFCWYAVRQVSINNRSMRGSKVKSKRAKRLVIRMHNFIMNPSSNQVVHHKDETAGEEGGLNNQRHNLKLCTYAENQQHAVDKREKDKSAPF